MRRPKSVDDKEGIPKGWIGPRCRPQEPKAFADVIARAKLIIWNGPPGVFEFDRFAEGTKDMAEAICRGHKRRRRLRCVGGGDTATAAKKFKVVDKVSHASTGGGASLSCLEGKTLPGVANLSDK